MPTVRTRFAPSPTGYMHIGGMRTALFNWLWAKHNEGVFILRIDDTDRERNVDAALEPILHAFRWLELDWDEGPEVGGEFGPYFQSQRNELYQQAAEQLLAEGKAYRCFETPADVQSQRQAAEKEKQPYLSSRRSLELSESEIEQFQAEGRPSVVRFLVPRDQTIVIDDLVRGQVKWNAGLMPDPVIVRGDGSPLYNFATVVDDAAMQISHVIRAEEHLSNTPVQAMIHDALGYQRPLFAHIPYVAAPGTKEKLSKRDKKIEKYRKNPQFKKMFEAADAIFPRIGLGNSETLNPVMVAYYEKIGYLPEAVFNALARLGWSLDDKTEIMSPETIIRNFTLDRVVKSPAGLDPDKFVSFQTHWMGEHSLDETIDGCVPYLLAAGLIVSAEDQPADNQPNNGIDAATKHYVSRVITALGDRIKLFSDILNFSEFFLADEELPYDPKAFNKRIRKEGAAELLRKFRDRLTTVEPFEATTLDAALHEFIEQEEIRIGEIIHALRVAVTGKGTGPGMFDTLALLGKSHCLQRIDRALDML